MKWKYGYKHQLCKQMTFLIVFSSWTGFKPETISIDNVRCLLIYVSWNDDNYQYHFKLYSYILFFVFSFWYLYQSLYQMDDDYLSGNISCLDTDLYLWFNEFEWNHDDFIQIKLNFSKRKKKEKKNSTMNCPCLFQTMRRREIQSFSLKLGDLKEYEKAREERAELNKSTKSSSGSPSSPVKLVKYGPKSKQEVRDRIGMKS